MKKFTQKILLRKFHLNNFTHKFQYKKKNCYIIFFVATVTTVTTVKTVTTATTVTIVTTVNTVTTVA